MKLNQVIAEFKQLEPIAKRHYAVISIKGRNKLACLINDEWVIDHTCKEINEMRNQGVIANDAILVWTESGSPLNH